MRDLLANWPSSNFIRLQTHRLQPSFTGEQSRRMSTDCIELYKTQILYQSAECLTLQGFPNHSQNDSTWQTEGFAMGQAIAVGRDFTSEEVRQLAKRAKDSSQARRLLAIAAVLDGASRQDAAKAAGMDRQTLRDWVIRFNEKGANGLVNIPSPGAPPKLDDRHKAFLARIV